MVERGRIKTLFIAGCAMLLITGCAGNTDAQKVSVQEHVSAPDTTALSSVMTIDGETVTKEEYLFGIFTVGFISFHRLCVFRMRQSNPETALL